MRGFQHSCFISYRHGDPNDPYDALNSFAQQVRDALASELRTQLNKPVFFDVERLKGGYFLNASIGESLCQSVCLVVIFVRDYLNEEKPYCAAELQAMLACESTRFGHLGINPAEAKKGHIITIAYRNPDLVPDVLKKRIFYDFSKHTVADQALRLNPKYADTFVEIAGLIADLYEEMQQEEQHLCRNCAHVVIPDFNDTQASAGVLDFIRTHRKKRAPLTLPQS